MIEKRNCRNCVAFNGPNQQGEPTCWNLVSVDGRQPTAVDWCDGHRDKAEGEMLDEVLDRLPFDDCGDNAQAELHDRIKAVHQFNARLEKARHATAQAVTKAAS